MQQAPLVVLRPALGSVFATPALLFALPLVVCAAFLHVCVSLCACVRVFSVFILS